jgi:hypothetical protein
MRAATRAVASTGFPIASAMNSGKSARAFIAPANASPAYQYVREPRSSHAKTGRRLPVASGAVLASVFMGFRSRVGTALGLAAGFYRRIVKIAFAVLQSRPWTSSRPPFLIRGRPPT